MPYTVVAECRFAVVSKPCRILSGWNCEWVSGGVFLEGANTAYLFPGVLFGLVLLSNVVYFSPVFLHGTFFLNPPLWQSMIKAVMLAGGITQDLFLAAGGG